jgi:hypothetical protein
VSACRSCGAEIVWAFTDKGKKIPLDPDRSPIGKIALIGQRAHVLSKAELSYLGEGRSLYVSHFATCPNASSHRRKR